MAEALNARIVQHLESGSTDPLPLGTVPMDDWLDLKIPLDYRKFAISGMDDSDPSQVTGPDRRWNLVAMNICGVNDTVDVTLIRNQDAGEMKLSTMDGSELIYVGEIRKYCM